MSLRFVSAVTVILSKGISSNISWKLEMIAFSV